jgi:RNA polymerase sigma factor (sigma-70 family)
MVTEQDLIEGCKKGDPKYQRELVARYAPRLLTVARRYAGDPHLAQDILQEGLIRVFQNLDKYQPTGSFEYWMQIVVSRVALRILEKHKKNKTEEWFSINEPIIEPEVYHQFSSEDVISLVAELPDGYRQIFNLFMFEELSHKEIAELLGITESTSRSQLSRARALLIKMMEKQQEEIV